MPCLRPCDVRWVVPEVSARGGRAQPSRGVIRPGDEKRGVSRRGSPTGIWGGTRKRRAVAFVSRSRVAGGAQVAAGRRIAAAAICGCAMEVGGNLTPIPGKAGNLYQPGGGLYKRTARRRAARTCVL